MALVADDELFHCCPWRHTNYRQFDTVRRGNGLLPVGVFAVTWSAEQTDEHKTCTVLHAVRDTSDYRVLLGLPSSRTSRHVPVQSRRVCNLQLPFRKSLGLRHSRSEWVGGEKNYMRIRTLFDRCRSFSVINHKKRQSFANLVVIGCWRPKKWKSWWADAGRGGELKWIPRFRKWTWLILL
jgi:hypothetical protein